MQTQMIQSTKLKEELALIKPTFVRRTYTIEFREFKDAAWYKGWFRGLIPSWGEWTPIHSYTSVKNTRIMHILLNKKAPYKLCRTEYRVIKEDNNPF